jgi:N-acetylneuraminate synthase/N,N'-diacetyllegionaminate synthase
MIASFQKNGRNAFYVAEIGLNHNGDAAMARRMIRAAAQAGADAVKFQTFIPEKMNSPHTASLLATGSEGDPDRSVIDFFASFVFTPDVYRDLKALAESLGMVFFSSPFDRESVALLEALDVPLYKIASSEVTNHELIGAVAATGKPAILSTGMCAGDELDAAVACFTKTSAAQLALLHCVSLYPAPPESLNRRESPRSSGATAWSRVFRSFQGVEAVSLAAALGARIFEKHFTVDRNHDCPDKDVSLAPDEFSFMIEACERAIIMAGSGDISCGIAEAPTARAARRSLFAGTLIAAGKTIDAADLEALRPGVGIPPTEIPRVVGRKSLRDIPARALIRWEDIEED